MSKNYYTANESFHASEAKIRQIVQLQLEDFFSCIKDEIENKIKQIDRNIMELRAEIKGIEAGKGGKEEKGERDWEEVLGKIEQMEAKMGEIERMRERDMERLTDEIRNRTIMDRSTERRQDRSPLFRKTNTAPALDLNNIIFGEENLKTTANFQAQIPKQKVQQQIKMNPLPKPPLPKVKPEPKALHQSIQIPESVFQSQPSPTTSIIDPEKSPSEPSPKIAENLNRNKNSFMRKKSLKKFNTIHEEDVQESMMSTT